MPNIEKKKRNPVGMPYVYNNHNRLTVRVTYQKKTYYISMGLPFDKKYFKVAQPIMDAIERDIIYSAFDTSLEKYKAMTPKGGTVKQESKPLTLIELWTLYTEFKKPSLEETTLLVKFTNVENWIRKFPAQNIKDAIAIRDYLVANTSSHQVKMVLMNLSAACNWAVESKLIQNNPFKGLGKAIKHKKSESKKDIDPFSKREMDLIIHRFRELEAHNFYADFVEFLFLSGCRPSEAIALKWKDVSADNSRITFSRAIVQLSSNRQKIEKGLKTQERRVFPCGSRLQQLLERMREQDGKSESFLFSSVKTTPLDLVTFGAEHWKGRVRRNKYHGGVITELVKEGLVERYRSPYNTRHTFITLAIQSGVDAATVASWVGNSAKTIYQHYCGIDRDSVSPDLR